MSNLATRLDPGLSPVDLFFDPAALSDLVGRPVQAGHLRWKRGVSAVARLHDDEGAGWVAAYSRSASDKLGKTFDRALAHGLELGRHEFDDGVLVTGPIALDPKLFAALRPFRSHGELFPAPHTRVLKYNPFRRVVFSTGLNGGLNLVGKVRAGKRAGASPAVLERLRSNGVPVLAPFDDSALPATLPRGGQLEYLPWYGEGDLGKVPLPLGVAASEAAGSALALLHRQPPISRTPMWRPIAGRLHPLVHENARIMPEQLGRLVRVADRLEAKLRYPGRAAVVHGDFSPDQVLVGSDGIRLIDFERCTYGAAAADLGSFAAVELLAEEHPTADDALTLPRTAALLKGYGAGPNTVSECEVVAWTAFYLLDRLREPFRACAPDWHERMKSRLALIEEVLG